MSVATLLWGAPRIHGELLKLGIDVGQTTVAKYMAKRRRPPSQGWTTFLRNHAAAITSMDLFVVPTVSFRLLYGFLILRHSRRELLWLSVTTHPNAEWIALQLTEACGWRAAPRYIVRDRDGAYGDAFIRRLAAMGIRIGRSPRGRHAKMDIRRGSLVRYAGTASIMSWCSAKGIFVICSIHTKNITMRSARTSLCARTRRSRATFRERAACFQCQS
jgi:hypothetical protein